MNTTAIHGSASVTLQGASIGPAGPPHTYFGMARQFANGLRPLMAAGGACAIPLAFLCAQTVECALKAFLSRSGDDRRLKQAPLRHNLERLWIHAASEGLPVMEPPPAWLLRLSNLHDTPYYLRYSTGVHGMVSPGPEPMCSDIEALVSLVGENLRP